MKKLAYLIACSLVIAGFFISSSAKAQSFADDYFQKTTDLTVNGVWSDNSTGTYHQCDGTTITTSYVGLLSNAATHDSNVNGYYQSFLAAMNNGGVWGVAQQQRTITDDVKMYQVIVAWSEDPNTVPVQFISSSGMLATPLTYTNNSWKMLTISGMSGTQNDHQCGLTRVFGETLGANQHAIFSTSPTQFVSNGDFVWAKTLFINAPIDYPTGYAGQQIPSSITVQTTDSGAFSPSWLYAVQDKKLTVQSTITDNELTDNNIQTCFFRIPNNEYGDNYSDYVYDCKDKPQIEHDFDLYSSYNIISIAIDVNGKEYQSARTLTIDGTSYNGLVGSSATGNTILNALNGIATNTHGLSNIVTAPLQFLAQLPSLVNSCSAVTIPWGNLGTMTLPCMTPIYQAHIGTLFTIYQTVLVGVFSYYMGLSLFRKIKNVSSPNDDRIEVVNL